MEKIRQVVYTLKTIQKIIIELSDNNTKDWQTFNEVVCIQLLYVIEYNYKVGGCRKRHTGSNICLVMVVQYVYEKL